MASEFDKEEYLKGELAPVFFGSALNNFGVQELLDCFVEIAPSPRPVQAEEREVEPEEPKFTGFVFKITANIDPNHRSCIAFCKICSGKFTRNAPYLHVRHGKTMRFSSPTQFMAQRKTTVDEAWACRKAGECRGHDGRVHIRPENSKKHGFLLPGGSTAEN